MPIGCCRAGNGTRGRLRIRGIVESWSPNPLKLRILAGLAVLVLAACGARQQIKPAAHAADATTAPADQLAAAMSLIASQNWPDALVALRAIVESLRSAICRRTFNIERSPLRAGLRSDTAAPNSPMTMRCGSPPCLRRVTRIG